MTMTATAAALAFEDANQAWETAQRDRRTIQDALYYAEIAARKIQDDLYGHACNEVAQAGLSWVDALREELRTAQAHEERTHETAEAAFVVSRDANRAAAREDSEDNTNGDSRPADSGIVGSL